MSADLYLRAVPSDPAWLERFTFLQGATIILSDQDHSGVTRGADGYLHSASWSDENRGLYNNEYEALRESLAIEALPCVWIGKGSWLGSDVPPSVARIADIVGSGLRLTSGVAGDLMAAMNLPNTSSYGHSRVRRITDPADIGWHRVQARTRNRRRLYGRFMEPGFVITRTRGLAKRQDVKAFLVANAGALLVTTID